MYIVFPPRYLTISGTVPTLMSDVIMGYSLYDLSRDGLPRSAASWGIRRAVHTPIGRVRRCEEAPSRPRARARDPRCVLSLTDESSHGCAIGPRSHTLCKVLKSDAVLMNVSIPSGDGMGAKVSWANKDVQQGVSIPM